MPSRKTMRKKKLAKPRTKTSRHKHTRKHGRKTGGGFKLLQPGPNASAEEKAQFRKGIMRLYTGLNFAVPGVARSKRMQALNTLVSDEWSKHFLEFIIPLFFRVSDAPNKYTFNDGSDYAVAWFEICQNQHITMKTIEDNPNIPWDWHAIITNPNFNIAFYERNLDKDWKWNKIKRRFYLKYLNLDFLEKYKDDPNIPWNWNAITRLENLTMDFVERNIEGIPWDWNAISSHKNLTMDFLDRSIEGIPWNWTHIAYNPALTMDFVERHNDINWNWKIMSPNPSLTVEFLEKNKDKDWDWYRLSANPGITLDYIKKNLPPKNATRVGASSGYFAYTWLSRNPNITMEFVQQNITEDWNWKWLSENPSITMEFVEKYIDKDWNWREISGNPSLTMEFAERHLDLDWNWNALSKNPSLTMEFAERHLDKIMLYDFFANPSITMKFFKELIAEPEINERIHIYLERLASNTFSAEKALFFQEWNRKYVLTTRLQKAVRERMFDNPEYKSARERQMKQFEETETPSEMTETVKGYLENIKQIVDYQKIPPELRDFLVKK